MTITQENLVPCEDQEGFDPHQDQEGPCQGPYQGQEDLRLVVISHKIVLVMNQLIHMVSIS